MTKFTLLKNVWHLPLCSPKLRTIKKISAHILCCSSGLHIALCDKSRGPDGFTFPGLVPFCPHTYISNVCWSWNMQQPNVVRCWRKPLKIHDFSLVFKRWYWLNRKNRGPLRHMQLPHLIMKIDALLIKGNFKGGGLFTMRAELVQVKSKFKTLKTLQI